MARTACACCATRSHAGVMAMVRSREFSAPTSCAPSAVHVTEAPCCRRRRIPHGSLERAWKSASVEHDVLPGNETCLGAAKKRAGNPELLRLTEAAGGIVAHALCSGLLDADARRLRLS